MITDKDFMDLKCSVVRVEEKVDFINEKLDTHLGTWRTLSNKVWGALITAGIGLLLAMGSMIK